MYVKWRRDKIWVCAAEYPAITRNDWVNGQSQQRHAFQNIIASNIARYKKCTHDSTHIHVSLCVYAHVCNGTYSLGMLGTKSLYTKLPPLVPFMWKAENRQMSVEGIIKLEALIVARISLISMNLLDTDFYSEEKLSNKSFWPLLGVGVRILPQFPKCEVEGAETKYSGWGPLAGLCEEKHCIPLWLVS